MKPIFLLSFFAIMMMAETLGINLSIATGLSLKNAYLYVILIVLVMGAVVGKEQKEDIANRQTLIAVHLPFLLLILYAIASWTFITVFLPQRDYETLQSIKSIKTLLIDHYLMFSAFYFGARTKEDATWIAERILWIIILGNVITLIDVYNIPNLGIIHERGDGRVSGPLGESNQYGAFATLFLPALVAPMMTTHGTKRIFFMIGTIISFWAMTLTVSRGAFVGLTAGLLMGLFLLRKHFRLSQLFGGALVLGFFASIALLVINYKYGDLLYQRVIEKSATGDLTYASSGRLENWSQALFRQMQAPITFLVGYGWDTYKIMANKASHNTYLAYSYELGVIGLALFLSLVGNIVRFTKQGIESIEGPVQIQLIAFLFGFLSILVAVFFVNLSLPWLFVWAYAGLMMRLAVESISDSKLQCEHAQDGEPLVRF